MPPRWGKYRYKMLWQCSGKYAIFAYQKQNRQLSAAGTEPGIRRRKRQQEDVPDGREQDSPEDRETAGCFSFRKKMIY